VGKGSVFTFQVELKEGTSETLKSNSSPGVIRIDHEGDSYRILVVDDKQENLAVAVTLLQMVGFETKEAINGADAISKFNDWNPDVILMDMRMPVMDGYEATRQIKLTAKGKNTPIIALTASTFEDELKKIDSFGLQGYIRKPFREDELFNTIGQILGIKYIYEDEIIGSQLVYQNAIGSIIPDLQSLPHNLLTEMREALSVADLDLFIELLKSLENDNSGLTMQLLNYANNYDYEYLNQLFRVNDRKDEK
jgi:CheY-like chemotaxis protein